VLSGWGYPRYVSAAFDAVALFPLFTILKS
jgi:hypothetical protein